MIQKVNRNSVWANLFVSVIEQRGIEEVCLSPGSRSTPFVFALDTSSIRKHIILDERSSAFFALGMAKRSQKPVAVITTSGTAAAEVYPAIVEARMSRTPLLICTADRPSSLRGTGANQTIFQNGLYGNHVVGEFDTGLPDLNKASISNYILLLNKAINLSHEGPVHINFPFDKPLEPKSFTDEFDIDINDFKLDLGKEEANDISIKDVIDLNIKESEKGLILCGWSNISPEERTAIWAFSKKTGFPIVADITSGFRNNRQSDLLLNAEAIFSSGIFQNYDELDVLIQFGATPTSKGINLFWEKSKARKYCVHPLDHHDPSRSSIWIKSEVFDFIEKQQINFIPSTSDNPLQKSDKKCEELKDTFLSSVSWNFEGKIHNRIHKYLPKNSLIIYGNSSVVRDADLFVSQQPEKSKILVNRGASGIDGMVSTALGASKVHDGPAFLFIGDLSFFYDLTALQIARVNQSKLCLILINNNSGGIFHRLPVSDYPKQLESYFLTPQNLDFKSLIESFDHHYIEVKYETEIENSIIEYIKKPHFMVIEIQTDAEESQKIRDKYLQFIDSKID